MKSVLMIALTALTLTSNLALASLQPDAPVEASLGSDGTLYISSDAAEVLYNTLNAKEDLDPTSETQWVYSKTASGISCRRHMNGSPTECTIKITKSGVTR